MFRSGLGPGPGTQWLKSDLRGMVIAKANHPVECGMVIAKANHPAHSAQLQKQNNAV